MEKWKLDTESEQYILLGMFQVSYWDEWLNEISLISSLISTVDNQVAFVQWYSTLTSAMKVEVKGALLQKCVFLHYVSNTATSVYLFHLSL